MSEPTEQDREAAREVQHRLCTTAAVYHEGIIAAALAVEREKARAPFLALATDLAHHTVEPTTDLENGFVMGLNTAARHITRTAEDS